MSFTIPNAAVAWNVIQSHFLSGDLQIISDGIAGVGVISGCAVSPQGTPNMTVAVASGSVRIGGSSVSVTSGNVTITANSSGNPRLDLICVNASGTKSAQAGTAAAAPLYPAIPGSSVVLAAVLVPTGAASITANNIVDKRVTVSSGGLLAANNLSDVASASSSRTSLGLGTMATQAASAVAITGGTITGIGSPSASSDVAIKSYVDSLAGGSIATKLPVKVATTANITLSGTQTIDGVSAVAADRVLVKNQTTGSQNGIYVVAAGAWSRAADADTSAEVVSGIGAFVTSGTQGGRVWYLSTADPITLGTTSLTFTQQTFPVGTTTNTIAAGDDGRISTVSFEVAGRVGTLTAETAGTTKTPRLYNRTGRTWTLTAFYASVDTAPTGSGVTAVIRKNGSATGAITITISAAANTGTTTGSLSVADGDYLQGWPTAIGSTVAGTDLSILVVGTTA
jgi:hypothetical protein